VSKGEPDFFEGLRQRIGAELRNLTAARYEEISNLEERSALLLGTASLTFAQSWL